jgi:hypothetical protein
MYALERRHSGFILAFACGYCTMRASQIGPSRLFAPRPFPGNPLALLVFGTSVL